ncbi:YccS family putative transporter [Pinirhizobacter sp.]|jgi:YccS/YhfK family integral membrane protein|uniref:YccS family putative transporter n=1 Tax=Pinirhizobacter sp. TaxID=2950432 RepID=UPI002F4230C3
MPITLRQRLVALTESDRAADVVRVLLALGGVLVWCVLRDERASAVPAMLGVIACAVAETDDAWSARLRGLVVTLACFALAAFTVRQTITLPWLFALALPVGTFVLVMLGAVSGRYATIAAATLILSVYMMIASDPSLATGEPWLITTAMLLGAAWYGVLSLAWSALAPQRAVRLALARLFEALAAQLEVKAALFEPVRDLDRDALDMQLASLSARTVDALNETRMVLLDRLGRRQPRGRMAARLRLYFAAQDIHERVSSSHYPYEKLAEALFHSDIMFRFGRLIRLQSIACGARAEEIRRTLPPGSLALPRHALEDVRSSVELGAGSRDAGIDEALTGLLRNVERLQETLTSGNEAARDTDYALQNPDPPTFSDALARTRVQITRRSMRFRHAVRLSAGMLGGYLLLLAVHPKHGYWILLTTLFVCQPGYGATRLRLLQRVAGTVLGLVVGWTLLHVLPGGDWRLPLVVATGAGFFAFWRKRYTLATATITLFVLLCFDEPGASYGAIAPRLLDTLMGAAVAAAALRFILPDWRGRNLPDLIADALAADAAYLRHIAMQYMHGRHDDLPYRVARRDAHNAHAALAGSINQMLAEPTHTRTATEAALRLMTHSQQVLAHLSTLGAHREALPEGADGAMALRGLDEVADGYERLARLVREGHAIQAADAAWLGSLQLQANQAAGLPRLVSLQSLLLAKAQTGFTDMGAVSG